MAEKRFRAVLFDRQRTRWRDTRNEALTDAIRRGWASRDDYPGAKVFLGVGVRIECESRSADSVRWDQAPQ